jgi:hypothetical protein
MCEVREDEEKELTARMALPQKPRIKAEGTESVENAEKRRRRGGGERLGRLFVRADSPPPA